MDQFPQSGVHGSTDLTQNLQSNVRTKYESFEGVRNILLGPESDQTIVFRQKFLTCTW